MYAKQPCCSQVADDDGRVTAGSGHSGARSNKEIQSASVQVYSLTVSAVDRYLTSLFLRTAIQSTVNYGISVDRK